MNEDAELAKLRGFWSTLSEASKQKIAAMLKDLVENTPKNKTPPPENTVSV